MNTGFFFIYLAFNITFSPPSSQYYTQFDDAIVDAATHGCKNSRGVESSLLYLLLSVEKAAGVPNAYRGMVLAAACNESGYNPVARGDGGKAVGLLQMWPWWERKYGLDRENPIASAMLWTARIVQLLPRARRKCGRRLAFVSAWSWVASGPKGYTCRAPRHYTRLKRWHRVVKRKTGLVPQ